MGTRHRPFLLTLLRLRHDLVIIGRAALPLATNLAGCALSDLATVIGDFLPRQRTALRAQPAPCIDGVEIQASGAIRRRSRQSAKEGVTRCLPNDFVTERFFALCFAMEQIGQNLRDLHRCVAEWAAITWPDE